MVFPSTEARNAYCPYNTTAATSSCRVQIQGLPVLQGDPVPPGGAVEYYLVCAALNVTTCQMVLPLGPGDALYEVTLLPADNAVLPSACSSAGIGFEAVQGAVSPRHLIECIECIQQALSVSQDTCCRPYDASVCTAGIYDSSA